MPYKFKICKRGMKCAVLTLIESEQQTFSSLGSASMPVRNKQSKIAFHVLLKFWATPKSGPPCSYSRTLLFYAMFTFGGRAFYFSLFLPTLPPLPFSSQPWSWRQEMNFGNPRAKLRLRGFHYGFCDFSWSISVPEASVISYLKVR
jgi:hypothetical protein